jgi:ABC-type nickel/cobalt efflux system permease component RcnA
VKQSRGPAPPPPLEANDQLVAVVGTVAWVVALVVLLIVRSQLPAGSRWWIWTCVAGLALGLFAIWYVPRLKRSRARSAADRASGHEKEQEQGSDQAGGQSAPRASGSNTVSSTETPGKSTRS